MKRLTGSLLASFALATATPAIAQPVTLELGARVCGPDQLRDETDADYARRMDREDQTPEWIWNALDIMQAVPDRMLFTLKMNGDERVLLATGLIDDKAADNLEAALKRYAPISEVWFNSPGGNSRTGVEMGRILRSESLGVRVRSGNGCASACSTAFLGGVMRRVEPGAVYGVHMYATVLDGPGERSAAAFNDIQWQGAMGAAERMRYVQEMGVSVRWLEIWSSTRPGCMTFMSQAELVSTFVSNID